MPDPGETTSTNRAKLRTHLDAQPNCRVTGATSQFSSAQFTSRKTNSGCAGALARRPVPGAPLWACTKGHSSEGSLSRAAEGYRGVSCLIQEEDTLEAHARSLVQPSAEETARYKNVARPFRHATAEFQAQCEPQYHLHAFSISPGPSGSARVPRRAHLRAPQASTPL